MQNKKTCLKCQGNMNTGTYSGAEVEWEQAKDHPFLKESGQKIITYACEKCGYLESYVTK